MEKVQRRTDHPCSEGSGAREGNDGCAPELPRGVMRSLRAEQRSDDNLGIGKACKDISFVVLRLTLVEMDLTVSIVGIYRFFTRRGTA